MLFIQSQLPLSPQQITQQPTYRGTNVSESWAAYAPNFVALQENEEYIEREDEFDEIEEDSDAKRRQAAAAEAERLAAEQAEAGVDTTDESGLGMWAPVSTCGWASSG